MSQFSNPADLGSVAAAGAAATTVITLTAAAPIGSLVVVTGQHDTAGGVTFGTCVDSRGNTYAAVGTQAQGGALFRDAMFASVLTTALQIGDTITLNLVGGTAADRAARAFYSTGPLASPIDQTVVNSQASGQSATTATTATLAQADELVVVQFGGGNTATITPSSIAGYTQFADLVPGGNRCLAVGWKIVSATSGVNAAVTWNAVENNTAWILATFMAAPPPGVPQGQAAFPFNVIF